MNTDEITAPEFGKRFRQLLNTIRTANALPLNANRSMVFASDTGTGKEGVKGARVMHCFDAFSMAWMAAANSRRPQAPRPAWAHGSIPHRGREAALLTVEAPRWLETNDSRIDKL